MTTNFDLPPPVPAGGRTLVPIDISAVDARLTFDGATRTAAAEAVAEFVVGPTAGSAHTLRLTYPNLAVVRAVRGSRIVVPFVARGRRPGGKARLEIRRPDALAGVPALITRPDAIGRDRQNGDMAPAEVTRPAGPAHLGLALHVPHDMDAGTRGTVDLVRRDESGRVVGGLAVDLVIDN
jgi:hypothetical protein